MDWEDVIVGAATAQGAGSRAILRITGRNAPTVVAAIADVSGIDWSRPQVGEVALTSPQWAAGLPIDLYSWPDRRSPTGQPSAELHFPACPPLSAALQASLVAARARLARPGEFTLRAFLAGKLDLAQAEGVLGLVEAEDLRQLAFAIDQRAGGLSQPVAALRSDLLNLLADLEAGLDFVDEDIEFISREETARRLTFARDEVDRLAFGLASRSTSLERPRVVLVGPPNAGKSSLFNALADRPAALVGAEAGTTRDYITFVIEIDGREVEVVDTAGVDAVAEAEASGIHEQAAVERARLAAGADLVALCVPPDAGDPLPTGGPRSVVVHTKTDLASVPDEDGECRVSVIGPPGVEPLRRVLASRLSAIRPPGGGRISERCQSSLASARQSLDGAIQLNESGSGPEYVAVGLRDALSCLGEIVGEVYTDDLLDRIFSRFCIGK